MSGAPLVDDTRDGVVAEAGDLFQTIAIGAIDERAISAEVAERGAPLHSGRRTAEEVSVVKLASASIADVIATKRVPDHPR